MSLKAHNVLLSLTSTLSIKVIKVICKNNNALSFMLNMFQVTNKYTKTVSINVVLVFLLLTLSCIMLRNGQKHFKNLAMKTPQDF